MLDNFSFGVQRVLVVAENIAKDFSHPTIGSEHLLLAILKNDELSFTKELNLYNVKYETFSEKIRDLYGKNKKVKRILYSFELKNILEEAIKVGNKNKESLITFDSLLVSFFCNSEIRKVFFSLLHFLKYFSAFLEREIVLSIFIFTISFYFLRKFIFLRRFTW